MSHILRQVVAECGSLMTTKTGGAMGATVPFTSVSSKVHPCPFCPYLAARKQHLIDHIRKHTGEKPFACPHCPYRSSKSINLKQHIRIHTGERPFACTACPFRAAQRITLIRHIQTHNKTDFGNS